MASGCCLRDGRGHFSAISVRFITYLLVLKSLAAGSKSQAFLNLLHNQLPEGMHAAANICRNHRVDREGAVAWERGSNQEERDGKRR